MDGIRYNHILVKFWLASLYLLLFSLCAFAQDPNQVQKSPVEIASEQADRLHRDLKLNDYQLFMIDSVLQTNIAGVMNEFEQMRKGGMQNPESYRDVQRKWQTKTEDAFEKLLTIEQFDRYLRITGVPSRERKKRIEALKKD